ncbi:MAG: hypothetical protein EZS28_042114, partial [Streblomastix strix]
MPNRRLFDDLTEAQMIADIEDAFRESKPFEPCTFIDHVRVHYHKDVSRGWEQSFRDRHYREIKLGTARPRESSRFAATHEDTDRYERELAQYVVGTDINFIFHIDESGDQPWVDAHNKCILCPVGISEDQCVYKVNRSQKNYTVMPCINIAGDTIPPLIIVNRLTLDPDIYDYGLRPGVDCFITTSKKGYMNKLIFVWWLENVFIPKLDELRPDRTVRAVLLMDNLKSHSTVEALQIMRNANIQPLFIPKNSSHALQPLDLSTFHDLKSKLKKCNSNFEEGTQAARIQNLCDSIEDATTTHKNRAAFLHAGLRMLPRSNPPVAEIDHERLNARLRALF